MNRNKALVGFMLTIVVILDFIAAIVIEIHYFSFILGVLFSLAFLFAYELFKEKKLEI